MNDVRTWIEIDTKALRQNIKNFLKLIPKNKKLMAVIKSNAYGHGLTLIAKQLIKIQNSNPQLKGRLWFGVDSITEGLRLREEGIENPILVLGWTLPSLMESASQNNITITVSNFESLTALTKLKLPPKFHLKLDTGMHRQGFLPEEWDRLFRKIKNSKSKLLNSLTGIYTHFASAKDITYPAYTLMQLKKFKLAVAKLKSYGFRNLIYHAAASGGTILYPSARLDMIRIGIALYGYWPSLELNMQVGNSFKLKPILTWKTLVGEVKEIPAGSFIGYDLAERVNKKTKIAILPIGYWHGFDRDLSSKGEVLIRGRRAKVLGRVSMDMIIVNVTYIKGVRVGDEVVLIGAQNQEAIWADEIAQKLGSISYEVLTRINPLIRRIPKS